MFTIFGESPKSLELTAEKTLDVQLINILDEADIEIDDLVYNKGRQRFEAKITNVGAADAYVDVELLDLWVNGETLTFGSEKITKISKGKSKWIPVLVELDDLDIENNANILVRGIYGERENILIKAKEREFAFKEKGIDYVTYALVIVVIILLILFLLAVRRKKKRRHGGHHTQHGNMH
ncbi:MAG: hypothetical protein ABIH41_04410 [Nanoarchaeota archaeon]